MIFGAFERLVALRYLGARRQEGFISVIAIFSLLGIALGVATLIIVMAVMNGFRQELMGRILGVNGHFTIYADAAPLTDYDAFADKLRGVPDVTGVLPQVQGHVMVTVEGRPSLGIVRGLALEDIRQRAIIADNIQSGSLEDFRGENAVMIGSRMARRLGLRVGDPITLVSPRGHQGPFGTMPRLKAFKVVGIFQVGMFEYDNSFIYMPLEAAQLYFRYPSGVNAVEVFFRNPDEIIDARRQLREVADPTLRIVDWQRANQSFFEAIQVERNVMFLILSLIILVAAFNILSGQYMLVKGKARDIAILRTMGASRGMILRVFFLSGALIGVVGTLAGFGLGVAFSANIETIRQVLQTLTNTTLFPAEIYFLSRLPAEIDPVEVVQVVAMALFWSFLAPLWPAWQAARLDPVEALRYE
ncbi:MAG: lipoprotein-releasing ABC transporter permease subunit [Kiloniellales bacterium]|nr:lipoprotein-releasing ABC transporter permease subunit [Kiloniellales bacterium]